MRPLPIPRVAGRAAGLALAALSFFALSGAAPGAPAENSPPGATLDGVLALARRLSPELAARALDTEAAQARVTIAGALPDPSFRVTSDEIDRLSGPRQNKMIYSFEQEFPLWGKRDLKAAQAGARVTRAEAEARQTEAELVEKVKVAFDAYYQADRAIRTTEGLHRVLHDIARVARERYAQGRGAQTEIYRAEIENTRVAAEIVRLETARETAAARLNALLARPIDAALARPAALKPLPAAAMLQPASLMARARAGNPSLAAGAAQVTAAHAGSELARKSWYPDVTVTAGAIDRGSNGPPGYMAAIGLKLPLQWGLHEAQEDEANAELGAARARREMIELQVQSDLGEALANFAGAQRTAGLLAKQQIPQAQALLRSGTVAYGLSRADLADVLRSQHDLADLQVLLLNAEFDAQRQLARIERLIGSDL